MVRNMMYGVLCCLMLSCLGCVKNVVYYPPQSEVDDCRFFVIVDNKPIGRNIQEVFVTVYGQAGNVYAMRAFEIPVNTKDTLRWDVNWESLDKLSIVFRAYKYNVGYDNIMTREIEPYHVFNFSLAYDPQLGTFVETADSDIPVQKWRT